MIQLSLPILSSSAMARCALFGPAPPNKPASRRIRHCFFLVSGLARNRLIVKSSGSNRVHIPPGLRKSGIPDSVLIPAPVNTTPSLACTIISATMLTLPVQYSSVLKFSHYHNPLHQPMEVYSLQISRYPYLSLLLPHHTRLLQL